MIANTFEERLRLLPDDSLELRSATAFALRMVDPQNRHSYDASIFKARKILETVLRDLYQKHKGCSQKDRRLETLIQVAYQECNLPRHLKIKAEHIRELGNASVHEEIPLTTRDIHTVFDYLVDILVWYFEIPIDSQEEGNSGEPAAKAELTIENGTASHPIQPSLNVNEHPVAVVPKGLRSFDRSDSNFFLRLMPGPYDEEGLPESIRFWLHRIAGRVHDDFSVGVIYGPSGGGKSSLVRAGLLPRLPERVLVIYLEATPDGTEQSLRIGLQRTLAIEDGTTLLEILRGLRCGRYLSDNQKVLIVIDQFEQRLHGRVDDQDSELAQALRQCDGARVQCLLIVRDDYWTPIDRFTEALDLTLDKSRNLKRVDLFDFEHSRNVLALFGRAYGRLSTEGPLSTSDQEFLDAAVSLIADDGKVIPVRLSLFAEMIRNKPWTVNTVRETGGAAGIGVAFLEDTFNSPESHPEHKRHVDGAKRLLAALVPDHGSDIKGSMRAAKELQKIAGYAGRDRDFSKLLRILSIELKLITLTGSDSPSSSVADSDEVPMPDSVPSLDAASVTQYYQLTHDYLVPSLREWLTRKMRETRRGRAELQLANYAAVWQGNSIDQYLPTLKHYAKIQWLVPSIRRTPMQQKMMSRASRYYATRLLVSCVVLLLLAGLSYELYGRTRATQLVRQAESSTGVDELNALTTQTKPYMRWSKPILMPLLEDENRPTVKRISAAWVLRGESEKALEYLKSQLLSSHETNSLVKDEVEAVRKFRLALEGHETEVVDDFWDELEKENVPQRRMAAFLALAQLDPPGNNSRWRKAVPTIVDTLIDTLRRIASQIDVDTAESNANGDTNLIIREEVEKLSVLQDELLTELEHERFLDIEEAAILAAIWLRNDPDRLGKKLVRSSAKQLSHIIEGMKHHPERSVSTLNKMLAESLTTVQESLLSRFDGLVTNSFALCPKLPLDEFESVTANLAKQGFRPAKVRPFKHSTGMQAAVIWLKDSNKWKAAIGVPLTELMRLDELHRKEGYAPIDLCFYDEPGIPVNKLLYTALWQHGADSEAKIIPAVPTQPLFDSRVDRLLFEKNNLSSLVSLVDSNGVKWFGGIGRPSIRRVTIHYQYDLKSYRQNHDDLGSSILDLQLYSADPRDQVDATATWQAVMFELNQIHQLDPDDVAIAIAKCEAAYHLEQFDFILEDVETRFKSSQHSETQKGSLAYWAAMAAILKSDIQLAEKYVLLYAASGSNAKFVEAMLHFVKGNETEAQELLNGLLKEDASFNTYNTACVYSLASKLLGERTEELRGEYATRAIECLRLSPSVDYNHIVIDSDLAPLRDNEKYKELLNLWRNNLKQFTSLTTARDSTLVALVEDDYYLHTERVRELASAGWQPVSLSTLWDAKQQQFQIASVWKLPESDSGLDKNEAIAKLCYGLFSMDATESVWPLLKNSSDPTLRTKILEQLAQVRPVNLLTKHLDSQSDQVNLCAILSALLQLESSERSIKEFLRSELRIPLSRLSGDSTAAVSNAAYRLAMDSNVELPFHSIKKNDNVFTTLGGRKHRMVNIPPKVKFDESSLMRSTQSSIGYPFAISATNVTGAHLNAQPVDNASVITTTYLAAMKYCRRLSEGEGIPEEEMCYPKEEEIKEGMKLPDNYLERTGYRLPTLDEWRLAVRSGVVTSFPWGQLEFVVENNSLKNRFETYRNLPNAHGLLHTLSSNGEWTIDPSRVDLAKLESSIDPKAAHVVGDSLGKSFTPLAVGSRGGFHLNRDIDIKNHTAEFRVARTLRRNSLDSAVDSPLAIENRLPEPLILNGKDIGSGGSAIPQKTSNVNYTEEELRAALETIKIQSLAWNDTTGDARKWWIAFEEENKTRIALVLKVAQEIEARKATITDFFLAYVYSDTDNIQATLAYLDYTIMKKSSKASTEQTPESKSREDEEEEQLLVQLGWSDMSKELRDWFKEHWARNPQLSEIKQSMKDQGFSLYDFYLADHSLRNSQLNDLYLSITTGRPPVISTLFAEDYLARREALEELGLAGETVNVVLQDLLRDSEFETLRLCLTLLGAHQIKTSELLPIVKRRFESAPAKEKQYICLSILRLDNTGGSKEMVEQLLLELLESEEMEIVTWAGKCIVGNGVYSSNVSKGIQKIAKSHAEELRANAVDWLSFAAQKQSDHVSFIIEMASDPSPMVRKSVAKRLADIPKTPESLDAIADALKALLTDGDIKIAAEAGSTLVTMLPDLKLGSKLYEELIDIAISQLKLIRESSNGPNVANKYELIMATLLKALIHNENRAKGLPETLGPQ
jgi:Domain of unknown function (DUF4145)/Sulfatase-modifying factor enzyme 1/AAA domain/Bacterial tandem repeat domain 1